MLPTYHASTADCVPHLIHIFEVLGFSAGRSTILSYVCRGFIQYCHMTTRIGPQNYVTSASLYFSDPTFTSHPANRSHIAVTRYSAVQYIIHHHHHHHHMSVMELGHLLTRSGLTYLKVSSEESQRYNCFIRNGGNAIPKQAGPKAKGSNPTTGLTLLWARNPFRGHF